MTAILDPTKRWHCPQCRQEHITKVDGIPMHNCPAVGFTVPFIPAGSNLVIREHEDYVGNQVGVRYTPEGRAVQSISTERPDGSNDLHVYPGSALGSGHSKLKD